MAPRTGRRPSRRARWARSRSSMISRQDTASTTRWWAASSSTGRPPSSGRHSAARSSGPPARSNPAPRASATSCGAAPRCTSRCGASSAGATPYCRHRPSPPGSKRSRSASWCSTTAARASRSRPSSGSVASSKATVWLKWAGSPERVSRSQCCTGVSGASPVTGPCSATTVAAPGRSPSGNRSAAAASSARVWWVNRCRGVRARPARRAAETIRIPRTESPPSVK